MRKLTTVLITLALAGPAVAVDGEVAPPPPPETGGEAPREPTEPPRPPEDEAALEPQVTIVERDGGLVQEYRVGGQLYMVRIEPNRGVPYYLIDYDGDGTLETRSNDITEVPPLPQWTLFRW